MGVGMVAGGATGDHTGMKCDSYREILIKNSPAGAGRKWTGVPMWRAGVRAR